jgi:hypothetical protein
MTDKASSVFPAADIWKYYESNASFNSGDRGFIVEKGLQEWLLAVVISRPAKIAATGCLGIHTPRTGADIVILIANLIGGAADESV